MDPKIDENKTQRGIVIWLPYFKDRNSNFNAGFLKTLIFLGDVLVFYKKNMFSNIYIIFSQLFFEQWNNIFG